MIHRHLQSLFSAFSSFCFFINSSCLSCSKPYSKQLSNKIDDEARRLIASAYTRTEQMLIQSKDKLKQVAEELLKKETMTFEDLSAILGKPVTKHKIPSDTQLLGKSSKITS